MASTPRSPRRGLPRVPGGPPWPPAEAEVPAAPDVPPDPKLTEGDAAGTPPSRSVAADAAPAAPGRTDAVTRGVRRGLPREPGGAPWPPAPAAPGGADEAAGVPRTADAVADGVRRGLPREPGGAPWPPASAAPAGGTVPGAALSEASASLDGAAPPADAAPVADAAPREAPAPPADAAPRPPLTVRRTVWPGAAARRAASDAAPAARQPTASRPSLGDYSPVQLLGSTAVLGVFALALAGIAVLLARFVLAIGPGREFLAAFPGEYPLPASAPVGLPVWLNWSHFLNSLFLLLIIRTGWQVRREKRPAAFWSPRNDKKRRISLALWFHQALDILWIANGVVFVVLLVVTGQWMRIVPTSWEVFPNALSAALQYASLDWPTENGWVNYNSLQQLSYFAITFVAAPLAIVSGVRLSGVWPKDAARLNRLYPVEWARKVHFPTMLFFVAFIAVHVFLVLATGALRNLNHMYAARGSVDPEAFTADPTGLLLFAASLLVMAAAWVAARPAVLVPIARLFGDVKQR